MLTRPGIRVVLRPGRLFYEVNNATPIADRAPRFNGEDLMISPELAARLLEISQQHTSSTLAMEAPAAIVSVAGTSRPVTIVAKIVPGRLALAVSGNGTPNTQITITLTGEISKDLPIVLIRRTTVAVDADGTYSIQMGYGPDAHQQTTITATAASATGTDRAVARIKVDGVPTGVTPSGLDTWPKD